MPALGPPDRLFAFKGSSDGNATNESDTRRGYAHLEENIVSGHYVDHAVSDLAEMIKGSLREG